jgi:restriction system protein
MLPMMQLLADRQIRRVVPTVTDALATRFELTPEDLAQRLPSGVQPTFVNRCHWAATYLSKAGLLERPTRGHVQITDRGVSVLASSPKRVDVAFLRQYPEFEEFRAHAKGDQPTPYSVPAEISEENPEESLYRTYDGLRQTVEADILDKLHKSLSWESFERLVVDLLGAMGYGGTNEDTGRRVTKRTGDDGIDGVIDEDRLGLDAVYIQAKKYGPQVAVGRPALQGFAGSLEGQRAAKGVFITTSYFTGEAEDYVKRISRRIVLIDGRTLARLMYDYGIGVRTRRNLEVKRVDEAYFEGEL